MVSEKGIAMDPEKVEAMKHWPPPTNLKELRAFLGTVGYYHQYVDNFATISRPLTKLTGKNVVWDWDTTAQAPPRQPSSS